MTKESLLTAICLAKENAPRISENIHLVKKWHNKKYKRPLRGAIGGAVLSDFLSDLGRQHFGHVQVAPGYKLLNCYEALDKAERQLKNNFVQHRSNLIGCQMVISKFKLSPVRGLNSILGDMF